jgi:hypothetical protein
MPLDDSNVRDYLRTTHETSLLTEQEKHFIGLAAWRCRT